MLYVRLIMGLLNNRVLVWLSVHLYEEVVIDNLTLKDSTAVSSLKKAIVLKCWITFELVILPVCFKNTCKEEFLIFQLYNTSCLAVQGNSHGSVVAKLMLLFISTDNL